MKLIAGGSDPRWTTARVYLDGVELHDCTIADEEAGMAIVLARAADGTLLTTEREVKTVIKYGQVKIVFPTEAP